jgi:hypothetical protein
MIALLGGVEKSFCKFAKNFSSSQKTLDIFFEKE